MISSMPKQPESVLNRPRRGRPAQVPFNTDLFVFVRFTSLYADAFNWWESMIWYYFDAEWTNSVLNRSRSRRVWSFRYNVRQYMQIRSICRESWFDMILMPNRPTPSWTGPVHDGICFFGTMYTNTCRCVQFVGKRGLIWFQRRNNQICPEQAPFRTDFVVSVLSIHADPFNWWENVIRYDFNAEPTNSVLNRPRSGRILAFLMIYTTTCRCVQLVGKHDLKWF